MSFPDSPPTTDPKTRPVLIIDDDPNAIELARRALHRANITLPTIALADGREAIAHLERCIAGEAKPPLFVFLDLNMPGIDGFAVLDWMRRQPALRRLPTIVLSLSTAERHVGRAFDLGATAYLQKFPPVSELKTVYQLAHAMFSVEELERELWPGLRPSVNAEADW